MSTYKSLSTANLPDPAIDPAKGENPTEYFNSVLYTGTGADQAITGVGFQPDWVWLKARNTTGSHGLFDSVRGATKRLSSNLTAAEDTAAGVNSNTFVAWNWKAGGSGVSNTDGNVTSTVSADTTSGFSVVTWTGDESVSDQIGHGLSQKPDVIIARRRDGTHAWVVWGEAIGTASNSRLFLNTTDAISTTGSIGASTNTYFAYDVGGGESWLAYCFHSIEGFSKFGSYTGNGSTDGPFVYTGFRPAFVITKCSSGSSNWNLLDSKRNTFNDADLHLLPNSTAAEATTTSNNLDLLSNGFKPRGAGGNTNTSGETYIFIAFAEQPFKFSNAR
jgi:hypothetical protein